MRQPVSRHQRGQPAAQRPQHQYHPQRHGQQEQRPERPTLDAMLGAVEVFVHAPLVFGIQATGHDSLLGSLPTRYSPERDRKSTRLNSSHVKTSYAVFCLKKKTNCTSTTPSRTKLLSSFRLQPLRLSDTL